MHNFNESVKRLHKQRRNMMLIRGTFINNVTLGKPFYFFGSRQLVVDEIDGQAGEKNETALQ